MSTSYRSRTTAERITKRMQETGRTRGKDSIYTVVLDGPRAICHTEATLDAWWAELTPEDKARLYELHLDGILGEEGVKLFGPGSAKAKIVNITAMTAMLDGLCAETEQMIAETHRGVSRNV